MLYVRATAEDRRFLMGHKTNSDIYSCYHPAASSVPVQELFRGVRTIGAAEMNGLSINRIQQLPQTTPQIRADRSEAYGSTTAAVRSCDHRVPDLLTATACLKNRRRILLKYISLKLRQAHLLRMSHLKRVATNKTIIADREEQSNEVEIVSLDPSLMVKDNIWRCIPALLLAVLSVL
ncbi:hypothetical protein ACEPPN_015292 [Leptodophora sp. 'Broadleaf-Isolate-01']